MEEAKGLRDDTQAWLTGRKPFVLADLSSRHASLTSAWLVLERDTGMQRQTRLDVGHDFPVQVVGSADALAVPRVLLDGDPTIVTQPAPAVFAGGGGVFPLDEDGN